MYFTSLTGIYNSDSEPFTLYATVPKGLSVGYVTPLSKVVPAFVAALLTTAWKVIC